CGAAAQPGNPRGDERVLWRVRIDRYAFVQFIAVAPEGTIYTAGGDATYAVRPDGAVLWTTPEAFGGYPVSLGADGTIYTALGVADDRYALVVALNPDGSTRWKFKSPNDARIDLVGPNVGPDGNIYALQGDVDEGGLGAFALDPQGNLLWSNPGDPAIDPLRAFTSVSDIVFGVDRIHAGLIGIGSGAPSIYTFTLDGRQVWTTFELPVHTTSFPVVDPAQRVVCSWGQTGMQAISADGEVEWVTLHPNHAQLVRRPAIDAAGVIYSGDFIGVDLWALDPDGSVRWVGPEESPNTLGALGISPDGEVLVAQGHGGMDRLAWVRGYSPEDGALLWQVDFPHENGLPQVVSTSDPAFSADGCVAYVTTHFAGSGNDYGYLYAIRAQECACAADFNGDGEVNTLDVLAFLNAWNAQDDRADFNGDGTIDTRDVLEFLNSWNSGC
ncbi:MAG TPA: GC-type dockerin domain-anchored protein, partial [Phycisphaerales bacterium]|nr:GC-type dockerin domain-anchored protein [Phycisphaerales bacterium]